MIQSMKVAVSIPDEISAEADRVAKELGTSRSALYGRALSAFLQEMAQNKTTAALDKVIDQIGPARSDFARAAAKQRLKHVEW